MTSNPQLFCPIRGALKAKLKAKDGLTFTEEKRRIECINFLLSKGYLADRIEAETVVIKFGHKGKNSLRADVVVYDRPVTTVKTFADEKRREFMKIIGEIKRSTADAESAKENQLKPALDLIPSIDSIGIYWDDTEQSIFFKRVKGSSIETKEASIATLPTFGSAFGSKDIFYNDLKPATDLVKRFARLDDVLHQAGHAKDDRYVILFKVLLLKIFDEQSARPKNGRMIIQDFTVNEDISAKDVEKVFNSGLKHALTIYGSLLPKKPTETMGCSGATLREISKILCPMDILGSSPQVIQDFFMYFGRFLYKVDLGQYFTPYEVIDLIVRIVNPKFGDVVRDPACGTADFLVGAKRIAAERHAADISSQLWGVDTAELAVNLSVFNMILNGDGRSNITIGDSLKDIELHEGRYTTALCNPPFGSRIVEKRKDVLAKFELGSTEIDGKRVPLKSQETGILFVEVCLKSVCAGGRVGIILPNGYLGNRSPRYTEFRRWLLKQARIATIIGFPRFTFKKSGADVSASVVVLEKRDEPLDDLAKMADFPIHFNLVEKVGWDLQSNRSGRVYKQDPNDGAIVLNESNEPVLDADFDRVLSDLYSSMVVDAFPWLSDGVPSAVSSDGWVVQAEEIVAREDVSLDPKRWCPKHASVTEAVRAVPHITIGDVIRPVTRRLKKHPEHAYRYVEIEKIYENFGAYIADQYFGWALPDRGKQQAAPGDIFIANIWSSAGKWMIAGDEAADGHLVVTTGCNHFEVIPGQEALLADLVFGLCSEAFKVQMRALATGSDGLSSTTAEDICSIVLPKIASADVRKAIEEQIEKAKSGHLVLPRIVREELTAIAPEVNIPLRSSHVIQV
ncbi:SAM-dependent DNA methyltransferase [Trinickia terrae]|uniref:site-specific DNA-methyltransferase (adenine-specific) n=1 Tax=Trinickia terrae TaxID=2571161 RepID=A0A4V6WQD7_9BURK|nr:N-6 DNA methylase [Trinickia terrae]TKC91690.1 SAM-dependent DNA methyltransferase [Trinickia terrae]